MAENQPRGVVDIQQEIEAVEGKDTRLWSTFLILFLVMAAGFASLFFSAAWRDVRTLRVEGEILPYLIFGFFTLVVLVNVYLFEQRRVLRKTRRALIEGLVEWERAEQLSFTDPLTDLFNRRCMDRMLVMETGRADRTDSEFTILMLDANEFKSVNTRFGHLEGDRFLLEIAEVLRKSFRKSDTVFRYAGDEFLVLMPDTGLDQAPIAIKRMLYEVERWNVGHPDMRYRMSLSYGMASYTKGVKMREVLLVADQRMYENKDAFKSESRSS